VALVESGRLQPGWALDLGCGSGATSRYLARRGYRVAGVDLVPSVLARAQRAAAQEGSTALFCAGDVADLGFLQVQATVAIDIGCFGSLSGTARPRYVRSLAQHLLPGGTFMLYSLDRLAGDEGSGGVDAQDIAAFAPAFVLRRAQHGQDRGRPSSWYLLQRA
jgi:cyclopropane fatty-acyl-phospholipid synthase-like methyltransferase